MVTIERLLKALSLVMGACEEFVQLGYFQPGVQTRFDQWIRGLPKDRKLMTIEIGRMAEKQHSGTGADINGVALDERGKPSLESLTLHYNAEEPGLFDPAIMQSVQGKLAAHNGPRCRVPWP